jgi:hypothetical protein
MTSASAWGVHAVPDDGETAFRVGPLALRLRRVEGELRALVHLGDEPAGEHHWTRWATDDLAEVELRPLLPDRPLVVEPEDPFWLLRGAEARIHVRVPIWVGLDGLGRRRHELLRVPTHVASDTWWGTTAEGELCYWMSTRARRTLTEGDIEPHLAVCPLQLVNRSDDDLPVEKIALRVGYLSLYGVERGLWADETRVSYLGPAEGSRIEVAGTPPPEAGGAQLVSKPAKHMARGFRARTFRRLRSMGGFFE